MDYPIWLYLNHTYTTQHTAEFHTASSHYLTPASSPLGLLLSLRPLLQKHEIDQPTQAQFSTTSPITLLASSSSQLPISQLIRQLRNSRCKDTITEEIRLDNQVNIDFFTCGSPCWMPRCERHFGPAVKMATSERGSDRLSGEMSARGRRSEETTGEEAMDAEFWVPEWARLGTAAGEEQSGIQRVAAAEQDARATGIMRRESIRRTGTINSTSTEDDEDPLLAFWGPAIPQATLEDPRSKVQPGTLPAGTNSWSSKKISSGACAPRRPRLDFASLPSDHNADALELLLSRQRTPCTDGPVFRPHASAPTPQQPPTCASRLDHRCEPGGTQQLVRSFSEKVGNWLHIRKFALQSRIGERRIWLRERFDRKRSARVCESEQRVRDEGSLVNVTVEEVADNGFAGRNLEMAEDVESARDGEVFGFELCRTSRRVGIDTGLRGSRE